MTTDWEKVQTTKLSPERNPEWPDGVRAISMGGLSLFGVHEKDNKLYWDGKEIVTKRVVTLGGFERFLAGLAAFATAGAFILELGKTLGFW